MLQEFDIEIPEKNGSENFVDHLSWLEQKGTSKESLIQEAFPDENFFGVEMKFPWYADFVNYLAYNVLPHDIPHH